MNIQRMHSEIKLRQNKLNSQHKPDLPTAFIDDFINDAQIQFLERNYSNEFETTQPYIDKLSNLVVDGESIAFVQTTPNVYLLDLSALANKYFHFVRAYGNGTCGKFEIEIVKHNELDSVLSDENRKPSLKWKRAVGTFQKKSGSVASTIKVYCEAGTTPASFIIDYIKIPRNVFYGGYDTLDYLTGDLSAPSASSTAISSEVNEQYHSQLVDIAVELISGSIEDVNQRKLIQEKIAIQTNG